VHYHKETLSFEVVDFEGPYNTIFRRSCYTKFMAIPSFTYLKLKLSGLCGVFTMTGNFLLAYKCEREAIEQADRAVIPDEARLDIEIKHRMGTTRCTLIPRAPDHASQPSRYHPPSSCYQLHRQL
jgi:hypothetical protein